MSNFNDITTDTVSFDDTENSTIQYDDSSITYDDSEILYNGGVLIQFDDVTSSSSNFNDITT